MFRPNALFYSDGYKVGHKKMLAPGTTRLYGTEIPRSLKYLPIADKVVSFLQQFSVRWLHDMFEDLFFKAPKEDALLFIKDMSLYLSLPYDGKHFEELHDLQYLPMQYCSLEEGIETNPNIPHLVFINTVDGFAWLTLYLETILSSIRWKGAVASTIALSYKRNAIEWVTKTDPDNLWLVDYMCHDFSSRGLNPHDQIAVGLSHATCFRGSDTLVTIPAARYYYNEPKDQVCINSVNASEHSVSTTKIFTVGEQQMIADWLELFPEGIFSLVSDTFDLWRLITEYLPANKEAIMARKGKLVIRPDSGDPVDIICGTGTKYTDISKYFPEGEVLPEYFEDYLLDEVREDTPHGERGPSEYGNIYIIRGKLYGAHIHNIEWNRHDKQYYFIDMYEKAKITVTEKEWSPAAKGVIELLWDIFGGTINEQGYKVLDPHIGAIYGDSITPARQLEIYRRLAAKGFAATNIILGIGSYTYQYNTRDTIGMAIKGAWFEIKEYVVASDHETKEPGLHTTAFNIYKDPVTDDGTKKSLKGFQFVYTDTDGEIKVESEVSEEKAFSDQNMLKCIYKDGIFYNQTSLTKIRENINKLI